MMNIKMAEEYIFVFPEIGKGGAERVIATLGNYLVSKGYHVHFISLGPKHDYSFLKLANLIEISHFPRNSKFDFTAFKLIKEIIETKNVPFVFCIDLFTQLFIGLLRRYHSLNFNIIVNLHITIPQKKTDYLVNFFACRFLRTTDWVVFISKNQQKYIEQKFLYRSKVNKKIIYNGIDTDTFKPISPVEKIKLRASLLGVGSSEVLIIKVAGIRAEKDHETAIKALRHLHEIIGIKAYLIIVGDGDPFLKSHLKEVVNMLGLDNFVKFIGFNTNVNEYLACCNLFTLTSHSVETFSLAALEAMACGLPVVLTDIGGASEMITPGFNGYLSVAKRPDNIATMWATALKSSFDDRIIRNFIVQEFGIDKMNRQYLELFNKWNNNI